jgi:hypothetical protein
VPESDDDTNDAKAEQSPGDTVPAELPDEGRGTIRWQDPSTARARQPTVAEARHRDKTRKAREAAERFAEEQERQRERKAATRRKVLMGSVAVVGLVGVVALGYQMFNDDDEVSATCVKDGTNEVVSDKYCSSGYSGGGGMGGIFIFAGSPYRYYYGGNHGGIGSVARGGTLELPKGTKGKTSSGTSIKRGGFGSSSHGSSGS